jgi:predicted nucleic acid-binding protein
LPAGGATSPHTQPAAADRDLRTDTWIAACCLVYDLPLATLNVKDFAEHEGLALISS